MSALPPKADIRPQARLTGCELASFCGSDVEGSRWMPDSGCRSHDCHWSPSDGRPRRSQRCNSRQLGQPLYPSEHTTPPETVDACQTRGRMHLPMRKRKNQSPRKQPNQWLEMRSALVNSPQFHKPDGRQGTA